MKDLDWGPLRRAKTYRDFLKIYLEVRNLSLSDFARATQFGRGFPGDVLSGKRRLTNRSAYAFEQALRVPTSGKRLFRFLVALEEEDVFPDIDRTRVRQQLEQLRERSWNARHRRVKIEEPKEKPILQLFSDPQVIAVYAACGDPAQGATFEQIQKRTSMEPQAIRLCLKRLEKHGLVCFDSELSQYQPRDVHLFLQASELNQFFIELFKAACDKAKRKVETGLSSPSEFYFTSTMTVSRGELSRLKESLRETILQFTDEAIDSQGDVLVNLTTALHST